MQYIVQHWKQLLLTTGGTLPLEKCIYVALEWNFPHDERKLKNQVDLKTSIQLTSGIKYYDRNSIVQSGPTEGWRNLGAWISQDGNIAANIEVLSCKCHSMCIDIAASQLQQHEINNA
jgi:hypothetical protein